MIRENPLTDNSKIKVEKYINEKSSEERLYSTGTRILRGHLHVWLSVSFNRQWVGQNGWNLNFVNYLDFHRHGISRIII